MVHISGTVLRQENTGNASCILKRYQAVSSDNKVITKGIIYYANAWPLDVILSDHCLEERNQILDVEAVRVLCSHWHQAMYLAAPSVCKLKNLIQTKYKKDKAEYWEWKKDWSHMQSQVIDPKMSKGETAYESLRHKSKTPTCWGGLDTVKREKKLSCVALNTFWASKSPFENLWASLYHMHDFLLCFLPPLKICTPVRQPSEYSANTHRVHGAL